MSSAGGIVYKKSGMNGNKGQFLGKKRSLPTLAVRRLQPKPYHISKKGFLTKPQI